MLKASQEHSPYTAVLGKVMFIKKEKKKVPEYPLPRNRNRGELLLSPSAYRFFGHVWLVIGGGRMLNKRDLLVCFNRTYLFKGVRGESPAFSLHSQPTLLSRCSISACMAYISLKPWNLLQALQEKLWNVAAPLYLKQNALASAAAKQVKMDEEGEGEKQLQHVRTLSRGRAFPPPPLRAPGLQKTGK